MIATNAEDDGQHDHKSKATRARAKQKGKDFFGWLARAGGIPRYDTFKN